MCFDLDREQISRQDNIKINLDISRNPKGEKDNERGACLSSKSRVRLFTLDLVPRCRRSLPLSRCAKHHSGQSRRSTRTAFAIYGLPFLPVALSRFESAALCAACYETKHSTIPRTPLICGDTLCFSLFFFICFLFLSLLTLSMRATTVTYFDYFLGEYNTGKILPSLYLSRGLVADLGTFYVLDVHSDITLLMQRIILRIS